jgi:DNA-binding CsgD family transcriptional regulator
VGESAIAAIDGSSAEESAPTDQQQITYDERFSIVVGFTGALPFNRVRDERIPKRTPTSEQLHRHSPEANRRAPRGAVAGRSPSDLAESLDLSTREREVLTHIRLGLTNRQIAERLFVSTNTVNKHVHQVLRKLNVRNRVQAAIRTPVAMN